MEKLTETEVEYEGGQRTGTGQGKMVDLGQEKGGRLPCKHLLKQTAKANWQVFVKNYCPVWEFLQTSALAVCGIIHGYDEQ